MAAETKSAEQQERLVGIWPDRRPGVCRRLSVSLTDMGSQLAIVGPRGGKHGVFVLFSDPEAETLSREFRELLAAEEGTRYFCNVLGRTLSFRRKGAVFQLIMLENKRLAVALELDDGQALARCLHGIGDGRFRGRDGTSATAELLSSA